MPIESQDKSTANNKDLSINTPGVYVSKLTTNGTYEGKIEIPENDDYNASDKEKPIQILLLTAIYKSTVSLLSTKIWVLKLKQYKYKQRRTLRL